MNIHELFVYDGNEIYWKEPKQRRSTKKPAGCLMQNGYRSVYYDGKNHYVHRIIYEFHKGPIPPDHKIWHLDGNKTNNQIDNLVMLKKSGK